MQQRERTQGKTCAQGGAQSAAGNPPPANEFRIRNRSGKTARVRVKGYPPGPTPPPLREFTVPAEGQPPIPNGQDASMPIEPPAVMVRYTMEAQYDNNPTWFPCSPDLELPESAAVVIAELQDGNLVEWTTE